MESNADLTPLITIVGQTASGKTALALDLARRFHGEIIAADSRTIYKGMSIGTAKPSIAEMAAVPHHLIDIISPDKPFNVHTFQQLANAAIRDISARGCIPFLVGGTGLYVDAVLFGFQFAGHVADPIFRAELEQRSVVELQEMILSRSLLLPANKQNPRHLIRVIERDGALPSRQPLRPNTLVLGLEVERETLRNKVTQRVHQMVEQGLIDEVRMLADRYGWDVPALQAPAYKAFRAYVAGHATLEEAEQQFVQLDMQYAKRQKTWFKRNKSIHWISKTDDIVDIVTTFLNK